MILKRIKTHQRVIHNFHFDLSQSCLFVAFTPLLVLDVESDQLSVFSLYLFMFQGVVGSPGVPAKSRNRPPFIGERVVTFLTIVSFWYQLWPLIKSMVHIAPLGPGNYHPPLTCLSVHLQCQTTHLGQYPNN